MQGMLAARFCHGSVPLYRIKNCIVARHVLRNIQHSTVITSQFHGIISFWLSFVLFANWIHNSVGKLIPVHVIIVSICTVQVMFIKGWKRIKERAWNVCTDHLRRKFVCIPSEEEADVSPSTTSLRTQAEGYEFNTFLTCFTPQIEEF